MPTRRAVLALGTAALSALVPRALSAQPAPGTPATPAAPAALSVRIDEPAAGIVDGDHVVRLHAVVSDPTVLTATLTVNGASYEVPVEDGAVAQSVVVVPGVNRVGVAVARGRAVARDSVTFFLRGARVELVALLTWPSRGEIIDLWAREPGGETCKWDHRSTRSGGRLLDFSANAIGFGSQAYVLPAVAPGRYRFKIHYWSERGSDDDRDAAAYATLLDRLDALDADLARAPADPADAARRALAAERDDVTARLDAWASPAAPQTPVRGEIVLFPNAPHERRWRFDVTVQRAGQLVTLGEVEVDAAMVRAARREAAR